MVERSVHFRKLLSANAPVWTPGGSLLAKRTRITRPYPTQSLQDVLPIAETIQRVNGGRPIPTDMLAKETGTSRKSSAFMQKLNSSNKYGLTTGSHGDEFVQLTPLGESITAPMSPEERADSVVQATVCPEVFRGFYEAYAGKRMPEDVYAKGTLVRELGVRRELTDECLQLIRRNGLYSGIVSEQSGYLVVGTNGSEPAAEDPGRTDSGDGPPTVPVGGRRTDQGEILLISMPEDPVVGPVLQLFDVLSLPARSIPLDPDSGTLIPPGLAAALDVAGGCVYIWPANGLGDGTADPLRNRAFATAWATIGAVTYKLDRRVVVVADLTDDPQAVWDLGLHDLTTVQVSGDDSLYLRLMPALVQAGVVSVSVG